MRKFAIVSIVCIVIDLQWNFSCIAQDTAYFSLESHIEAKVTSFCNNSQNKDFSPFVWNDLIFITSSRLTSKNKYNIDPLTKQPFLNIYAFDRNCKPAEINFLPLTINTNLNCGPVAIARDTSLLVITKNYLKPNKNKVQNLCLAFYVRENRVWSEEKIFPYNNENYSLQHPYYDDQTKTLYFSSNLPVGFGKFDLFKSTWNGKNWSQPENLGPEINSFYNEVFPSIMPDGNLIYTSDHPGTTGGLDLVMFKNNTRYLLPEPLNTSHDDFSMTFNDKSSGYMSSNRDPSSAEDNIYQFEMVSLDSSSYLIRVMDKETQLPVPMVSVGVRADNPRLEMQLLTSDQGEGILYRGTEDPFPVSLKLKKEGYMSFDTVSGNFQQEADQRIITLYMKPKPPQEDTLIVIGIRPVYEYYIIIGSFKDLALARQKAMKFEKDYNTDIFVLPPTKEGYYRISYGKYLTLEEAKATLKTARPIIGPNSWIFAGKK